VRELQGLSQNELARRTGISQATISAIENDWVRLGVERVKAFCPALSSGCSGVSGVGAAY
jgi:transcriptional regulator with XRE-family HTH domain